jgi:hypothetical protein
LGLLLMEASRVIPWWGDRHLGLSVTINESE